MQTQLVEYFTTNSLLPSQQYRFRSNQSTNLAEPERMDRKSDNINDNLCPINIDFFKVFDCLIHNIILYILKLSGIQFKVRNKYLTDLLLVVSSLLCLNISPYIM